jgi:hypothetical protein
MVNRAAGAITTRIGNGDAEVDVTYRADRDYDERGVFWDIDWENIKVFFGGTDITDTLGDSAWKHIEEKILEDLE